MPFRRSKPKNEGVHMNTDMLTCVPRSLTRRNFVALTGIAGIALISGATLTSCSSNSVNGEKPPVDDYSNWDSVLSAAQGQTVSWYGYGGEEHRNEWIREIFAPHLLENFGITLNLVGMNINDILTQLSGEIMAGRDTGTIDFVWINGENFYSTKQNGFLWGPFCSYLPNFNDYVDANSPDIAMDFGEPTEGFEAPYGKTQLQMWVDGAHIITTPNDPTSFLEFCKSHQGKITYPEPGDFIGTAFICSLIAGVIGKDSFEQLSSFSAQDATPENVRAIIEPGLEYLRSLNPYLWQNGTTFPADSSTVSTMFADGELILNMGFGSPQALVDDKTIPATTTSFLFETGTVGNTNFLAIPINAPHKEAALVAINEILSPEMQLSLYETLTTLSVLDPEKLSTEQLDAFNAVPLRSAEISQAERLDHRITEASGPAIPVIEQLWLDEVAGK